MRSPGKHSARLLRWTTRRVALPMAQTSQVEGRLTAILRLARRGEVARRGTRMAGLLALALLAGLAVLRVEARRLATVDASTPLTQGGFTLVAVQRGDGADYGFDTDGPQGVVHHTANMGQGGKDGTGLWIQPPPLLNAGPDALRQEYKIRVRASNGTQFTLPYGLAENGYPTSGRPPLLCVGLPPGYPDSDRYFDVTIADRHGRRATWRLTNLPPMRHVLAPPVAPQSRFSGQGFTVEAQARHTAVDPKAGYSGEIFMTLRPVTLPPVFFTHHWDMALSGLVTEWQPEDFSSASVYSLTTQLDSRSRTDWISLGTSSPYAQDMHYVSLDAEVRQYETYDEPVTFHDVTLKTPKPHSGIPAYCVVAAPQSVTTPSGITVTLPVLAKDGEIGMPWMSGGVDCQYTTSLPTGATVLAASPLCRQYRRPVTAQVTVPAPYRISGLGGTQGSGIQTLSFIMPKPYPTHLAGLTLIVRQRVELQSFPLHFTVPVVDAPPTPSRKGHAPA